MRGVVIIVFAALLLAGSGCRTVRQAARNLTGKEPEGGQLRGVPEVPARFRSRGPSAQPIARVTLEDGSPGGGGAGATASGTTVVLPGGITPEEDIVWTDPDNPDAALPGLEETLATQKKNRGPWEVSHVESKRLAMREGKPLLIWFTNSLGSPACRNLSAELFSTGEFDSWAGDHLVRLRLDYNVRGSGGDGDEKMDDRVRKRDYLEMLKKRYNAGGFPTVLVMAPDGTVTGRYRGYRPGAPDFYFGRLKTATGTAEDHHRKWAGRMEKKGYRTWTDLKGRRLFAKLVRYRDGELILVEPDGRKVRAQERKLSHEDRLWIKGEQAKRQR